MGHLDARPVDSNALGQLLLELSTSWVSEPGAGQRR